MRSYSGLLNNAGVGSMENPCITLESALGTCSSSSVDSINLRLCRTSVCIYWKNLHINGIEQFKPLFFKVNSIHKEHNPSKIKVLKNTIFFNSKIGTVCMLSHFSHVWLLVTLQTAARQAPQSMGFSREEYWSGLPCSPPGDLPNPGIEPKSPTLLH